eukprot:CAMPEP_0118661918 /NCGR_PEP_ID=MMETSP0785-20121206/16543_1 /TAXON_ID=91992 /ORGANISM="Bolidomonas pacifica, Strain CCMP 1866" /LENGTH=285 /DNA_ID=CAMNT_0006555405 /DNA_START=157 /DNA_END=1010 /DNA_ORIENTATION=-
MSSPRFILKSKNEPTHDVRSDFKGDMDPEEVRVQSLLAEHQQKAARLDFATAVRSLVAYQHGFAVLSTISKSNPGYPGGSVVGFAPDERGRPVFVFSGMSSHTQDVLVEPRCSLTVASQDFKGAADGRVNLMGSMEKVPKEKIEGMKELYLAKHPGAFWVNFGDFNWFRMNVESVRFVGGFARAGDIKADDYTNAEPDPIVAIGGAVGRHMNEDHEEATVGMIKHYIGFDVESAKIVSMDSLGMDIVVSRTPKGADQPQSFKIRLPFEEKVVERKMVKDMIVKMT